MAYEAISVQHRIGKWRGLLAKLLNSPETWSAYGISLAPYFMGGVRYVRPAGESTGADGGLANTDEGAWSAAEFITHQGSLSAYTRVVFTGDFTATSIAVTANQLLLDARNATVTQGSLVTGWTEEGAEYKVTGASVANQAFIAVSEDMQRMEGWSPTGSGADTGRLLVTSVDTTNEWVTLTTGYELVNGDKIALVSGTLAGVSVNTLYYVVDAQTFADSSQAVGLSLTEGGAKVDLTAAGSGSRFFFSDFSGRHGIPVAGSLAAGQFAYVPWEDAIYIKPSSGVADDHDYHVHQSATSVGSISLTGTKTYVLGGTFHTNARGLALLDTGCSGSGYLGSVVMSGEQGIQMQGGATGGVAILCEVSYVANHAIGSFNVANGEASQLAVWNYIHDNGTHVCDWGDFTQALVTNPQSDGCTWHWNIIYKAGRPIDPDDIPTNAPANTGAVVIDSSSNMDVRYNYVCEAYGEQVEIGPNDVQSCLNNTVAFNIFDMRDLLDSPGTPPRGVNLLVNAASGAFGADATNVIHNNLFLLGDTFGQCAGAQDAGVFVIRVATANNDPARTLTVKNNVVSGSPTGVVPTIYALRKTNASYTHGAFVADGNVYQETGVVGISVSGVGTWPESASQVEYNIDEWRAYSGVDKSSSVVGEIQADANGAPFLGFPRGAQMGLMEDLDGVQGRGFAGPFFRRRGGRSQSGFVQARMELIRLRQMEELQRQLEEDSEDMDS